MAKKNESSCLTYTGKYHKSLSMEELSSLAREICSPIDNKFFYQVESKFISRGTDSFESSHCNTGDAPKNYHSWPKKYPRQRRMRKDVCRGERAGNISRKKAIDSSSLFEQRNLNSLDGRSHASRNFEGTSKEEKYRFSENPFYGGDKSNFICKTTQYVEVKTTKNLKEPLSNKICFWDNSEKDYTLLSAESNMEYICTDATPVMSPRNKAQKGDSRRKALSLLHKDMDCSGSFGSIADFSHEQTCQKDVENLKIRGMLSDISKREYKVLLKKSPENKCNVTTHLHKEKICTNRQRMKNGMQKPLSSKFVSICDHWIPEEADCSMHGLETCKDVDGTETSNMLKNLSLRYNNENKDESEGKYVNDSDVRIVQSAFLTDHLNGIHTDESSESSDSGVGNIGYDIIHRTWDEPTVSGPIFKKRLEIMKQWYIQFDNDQRSIILKMLLENSQLPQMHMLSEIMGPVLHKGCPPNCQDLLTWLPASMIHYILTFLDPVSLARASQVNKTWHEHCEDGRLWRKFCCYPDMQLSPAREREQIIKHTNRDGTIQWKRVFILRYCLRRNWLNGKCKIRTFTGHTQAVFCVQFDETRIVSGSSDKTIKVWDIKGGCTDPVLTLVGHSGAVRCLHLNGNRLVSGSADATIKVWDLEEGCDWSSAACKVTMVGHVKIVRCLQVDDEKIVSGSYDRTLKLWDIKTGLCKATFRGHSAPVLCVQFDSEKIVSGSADKTIKVWSIKFGNCLNTMAGHTEAVTCLQFNAERIFSGSLDCSLKFWDLCTGQCIGTIDWISSEGHTRVVRCLQTDSWKILSAGDDKALKIWSLETGNRFFTLRDHTDGVTCLQFNDHMLVSGSYDKSVKIWDFSPDDMS